MPPARVVLLIPTHQSKKYSIEDCLRNIAEQTYPKNLMDAIILFNNSPYDFYHHVEELSRDIDSALFKIDHLGQVEGENKGDILARVINMGTANYLEQYEPRKDKAIRGLHGSIGKLYFLVVGADVMMPNTTIAELLNAFHQFKDAGISCLTCYYRGVPQLMDKLFPQFKTDGKIPMVLSIKAAITPEEYYKRKWYKALAGNGAMLYPRIVAESVKWREDSFKALGRGSDLQFCIDVHDKLGLWTYINTRLYTPHMDLDKSLS